MKNSEVVKKNGWKGSSKGLESSKRFQINKGECMKTLAQSFL